MKRSMDAHAAISDLSDAMLSGLPEGVAEGGALAGDETLHPLAEVFVYSTEAERQVPSSTFSPPGLPTFLPTMRPRNTQLTAAA